MPAPTSTYRVDSRVRRRLFAPPNGYSPASTPSLPASPTTTVQVMNRTRPPTRRVLFQPSPRATIRPSDPAPAGPPLVPAPNRESSTFVMANGDGDSYNRTRHDRSWNLTRAEIRQHAEAPYGRRHVSESPSSDDVYEEIDYEAASRQAEVDRERRRRRRNTVRQQLATAEVRPWEGRLSFLNRPNLVSRIYDDIFALPQPVRVPVPFRVLRPQRPHARPAHPSTAFLSNSVSTLTPGHPSYPPPGSDCSICLESFTKDHPPALVVNIPGCRGHVFGYECLRKNIASGMGNSNKCPLCRTRWFRKYVSGPPRRRGEEFERGEVLAAGGNGTLQSLFILCAICMVIQLVLSLIFPVVARASRSVFWEFFWLWDLVKCVLAGGVE